MIAWCLLTAQISGLPSMVQNSGVTRSESQVYGMKFASVSLLVILCGSTGRMKLECGMTSLFSATALCLTLGPMNEWRLTMATLENTRSMSSARLELPIHRLLYSCNKEFGIDRSPSTRDSRTGLVCMGHGATKSTAMVKPSV
jgi:hypothetical protein